MQILIKVVASGPKAEEQLRGMAPYEVVPTAPGKSFVLKVGEGKVQVVRLQLDALHDVPAHSIIEVTTVPN